MPKQGDGKKKKKPSSFNQFWNKLLRKDRKKGANNVTDKTVQKAVSKVAKVLQLKKKEQKQVTSVLAAEVQQLAHDKPHPAHHPSAPAKEGDDVYPMPLQTGLFEQEELNEQQKESLERGDSVSLAEGEGVTVQTQMHKPQPESITLDQDTVQEIKKHTLISMLKEVMAEASQRQKAQFPNEKRSEEMNPDELIELRKRNLKEWEAVVKENTVVSYALSKPTDKEVKKAKKAKEKKKRQPLQFDDKVEVTRLPVRKNFDPNEPKGKSTDILKRK